ncbi:hypothetical protein F0T03_08885 [Yersinia canariae]|uniref:Uncharacterized protein n=1 Tax=Yersinia canariae TaxID=2607663 RepID=A0A857EYG3_9GAMM|nr:hypothetical protein [Yersinia canariae]QHB32268.1 hypothetical protein F0T03_08885 [Yersinia canariae]
MEIRLARPSDYPAILQLQSQNTPEILSSGQRKQGFIVSQMSEKQLDSINQELGILVAIEDEQVTAFVNHDNPHSLAAHVKGLNMTPACEFSCQQQHYQLLIFATAA